MTCRKLVLSILVLFLFLPLAGNVSIVESESRALSHRVGADEADNAAAAGAITTLALDDARNILRQSYNQSITQKEFTDHLDAVMRSEGSDGALSFPTVIMAHDESTKPYGYSNDDEDHVISPLTERLVVVRAGARVNEQCVDVTRTYLFETATPQMREAYEAVLATEEAVIGNISSGVSISYLDGIVRTYLADYISDENVSASIYWGHGVGEKVLVDPFLHNETDATELLEGQLLAIQIWVYFSAGWYIRVEDTILVTDVGVSVLSTAPKSIDEISILSNSSIVEAEFSVSNYGYDRTVSTNCTISDGENRTIGSVEYFDGLSWSSMDALGNSTYSHLYLMDHAYPSFLTGLVRVGIAGVFTYHTITLATSLNSTYEQDLEPPISIVFEQVTIDTVMSWSFTKIGADMIRVHFSKVYPPPGDQFLVKDDQGRVVYEYKWNLGSEAMSPWVPGNTLVVEVVPTWSSIYGGVNHFYFEVDVMGIFDPEAPTTTTSTSTTTESTTTTTASTSTTSTTGSLGSFPIVVGIAAIGAIAVIIVFAKRR